MSPYQISWYHARACEQDKIRPGAIFLNPLTCRWHSEKKEICGRICPITMVNVIVNVDIFASINFAKLRKSVISVLNRVSSNNRLDVSLSFSSCSYFADISET